MKRRGYPDRRGMGSQSDFISEVFVPDEAHKAEQMARARVLLAGGLAPSQVAAMLSVSLDELGAEVPEA